MNKWKKGAVTLAYDELYKSIKGKKIALMMNTTAIDNEGNLLIDEIVITAARRLSFSSVWSTAFAATFTQETESFPMLMQKPA